MENNESSFSDKLEKAFKAPRNSSNTVEDSLAQVQLSENMVLFFKRLASDANLKKFVFLHRFDLFRIGEVSSVSYIYFCSSPKSISKIKAEAGTSPLLTHIIDTKQEGVDVRGKMLFKGIEDEEGGFDTISKIALYFLIDFIRKTPQISSLANGDSFDYKILCEELNKEENPINLGDYFASVMSNFDDPKKFDPIIKGKIEKLMGTIVAKGTSNSGSSIEHISGMFPDIMMQFHKTSYDVMVNLMTINGLSYKDYENVLNSLYLYKLIENKSTMFWCEFCSKDHPAYSMSSVKSGPENFLKSRKCIACDDREKFSSIYGLNSQFRDILYSKDGLLSVYFSWLLKRRAIKYKSSYYVKDYESDFIINDEIIVECKTFIKQKTNQALQSKLFTALKQLETQIKNFAQEQIPIKSAALLWNVWDAPQDIVDSAKKAFPELFDKYRLAIIGPKEVETFVNTLV